ncbi:MAG: hypothetical protein Fur0034_20950 [Desulfuromonadia bacterium]
MKRFALSSFICLLITTPLQAEIYKWIDGRGVTSYTDNPASIPEKYRKRAIRIDEPPPPVEEVVVEPKGEKGGESADQKKGVDDRKKLYEGKDEAAWNRELSHAAAELSQVENQIADVDDRLAQREKLTRNEYLTLQNTRKLLDIRYKKARQKHEALLDEARRAGVPLNQSSGGGN